MIDTTRDRAKAPGSLIFFTREMDYLLLVMMILIIIMGVNPRDRHYRYSTRNQRESTRALEPRVPRAGNAIDSLGVPRPLRSKRGALRACVRAGLRACVRESLRACVRACGAAYPSHL